MRFTKSCDYCGAEHTVVPSDIKFGKGKTCSKECRYKLAARTMQNGLEIKCENCGKIIYRSKHRLSRANYCSPSCMYAGQRSGQTFKCVVCGTAIYRQVNKLDRVNKFCGHSCQGKYYSGANNPQYKGGTINKNGYRRIHINGKAPYEHRYIMEQHLGRKLGKHEDVHHIDRNPLNNHISNLQVLTKPEHTKLHQRMRQLKKISQT